MASAVSCIVLDHHFNKGLGVTLFGHSRPSKVATFSVPDCLPIAKCPSPPSMSGDTAARKTKWLSQLRSSIEENEARTGHLHAGLDTTWSESARDQVKRVISGSSSSESSISTGTSDSDFADDSDVASTSDSDIPEPSVPPRPAGPPPRTYVRGRRPEYPPFRTFSLVRWAGRDDQGQPITCASKISALFAKRPDLADAFLYPTKYPDNYLETGTARGAPPAMPLVVEQRQAPCAPPIGLFGQPPMPLPGMSFEDVLLRVWALQHQPCGRPLSRPQPDTAPIPVPIFAMPRVAQSLPTVPAHPMAPVPGPSGAPLPILPTPAAGATD